jgi:predicted nucleic acid-binding protein
MFDSRFRDGWTVARFMLDTSVWITANDPARRQSSHYPAVALLFEQFETGRVMLGKAGMVDVERTENATRQEAARRLGETAHVLEAFGPMLPGHGRLDHSVQGGEYDDRAIDRVLSVVHPGSDRYGMSTTAIHNLRDAIHIWTAMRNGWTAFVTEDPAVIRANKRMIQQADWSLRLLSPAEAVEWVEREIRNERIRAERLARLEERS